MSQRTIQLGRRAVARGEAGPVPSPARTAALRGVAVAGTLLLIAAFSYDLLTGRWIEAPAWHVAIGLVAVVAWLPVARQVRHLHFTLLYIFGLFVYTVLRGYADETFIPVRVQYVITLDRLLFFGHAPTSWLQARLFDPTRLRPLDWLTVQIHWSYFLLPHLTAALVYLFRRDLFPRFVALVLLTFYLGLVLYFLLPTAPPWLAADQGALLGVARIMDFVGGHVDPEDYRRLYDAIGVPNAVAAMPSLHMAITFAVFLFVRDLNRWLGRALLIYAVLMGFSLVYMGEHYATDVLAGVLVAFAAYRMVRRLTDPAIERGAPVAAGARR